MNDTHHVQLLPVNFIIKTKTKKASRCIVIKIMLNNPKDLTAKVLSDYFNINTKFCSKMK